MQELTIDPEFREIIPALSDEEYSGLEESLKNEGCRDALVIWNEILVDGHNRYEICQKHNINFEIIEIDFADRTDVKIWIIQNQFNRRNLNVYQRSDLGLILEPLLAEKAKQQQIDSGKQHGRGQKKVLENSLKPINTQIEVAKIAGVSQNTIAKVKKIKKTGTVEQKEKLIAGEVSVNHVHKQIKTQERREEKTQSILELSRKPTQELGDLGSFPVIYADPPWRYEHSQSDSREIENQYPTMTLDDIKKLEIPATPDAILFLWGTSPKLAEAMEVITAWGFNYRTCMVWVKGHVGAAQFELNTPRRQGCSREAHLYENGYAVKEIAELMRRPANTIRYWLHKQGIDLDLHREVINRESLTERQRQVLDGEMLGDGCLAKGIRYKNARLQWHLKSLGHTQLLAAEFSEFDPIYKERKDRQGWRLWTKVNEELTDQHTRWYSNKVKIVPTDLQLSPLVCFHWYIGDGYLQKSGGIELATFGFTETDNSFLVQLLGEIGIDAKILTKPGAGHGNYIALGKIAAEKFLAYIGHCRVEDYAYKWGDSDKVLFGGKQWGMGYYARQRHELLLIAIKGKMLTPEPANRPDSVIEYPRGKHSEKPDVVYDLIEQMYPDLPKLEMFARNNNREKWSVWGNESQ